MRWLITGYGPFEDIADNISARVARDSGHPFEILEVSYQAVDDFISSLDPNSFDAWIALGHAKGATKIRVEGLGRNVIGPRPDVRGEGRLNEPITAEGPATLFATLWTPAGLNEETDDWLPTDDAGGYLCNYILYRALETFPGKQIGFLHLPPSEIMSLDQQLEALKKITILCEEA